jgi:prepilin-type N-terminal cleavage/methylation domain-containing protein
MKPTIDGVSRRPRAGSGFTLVELLVVIAVIGILVGVLTPALGRARETSQSMVGMSNIRQLATAQQAYASENQQWLAGPTTSGVAGMINNGESYLFSTSSTTPTTTHDWISPTLGSELGFSPNRADRTWQIFGRFKCPRANEQTTQLFGDANDRSEFEALNSEEPAFQVSYLSPAVFFYSPEDDQGDAAWVPRQLRRANKAGIMPVSIPEPFAAPSSYRPRFDRIRAPSAKVIIADGTRFVDTAAFGGAVSLNFDMTPNPGFFGSFLSSGPIFHESTAYGREALPERANEINVDYSMRYFDREMHIGYFDGHAERIGSERAWADVELWYPSGSQFTGGDVTPEASGWDPNLPVP